MDNVTQAQAQAGGQACGNGSLSCGGSYDLSDKHLSVLTNNTSDLARQWVAVLLARAAHPGSDCSAFEMRALFKSGFQVATKWGDVFGAERAHFNVTPREITRDNVQGIIDWWQPKIAELRRCAQQLFQYAEITDGEFQRRNDVLQQLDALVARLQSIVAMFDKCPAVKRIVND